MSLRIQVFWDVTLCHLVRCFHCFKHRSAVCEEVLLSLLYPEDGFFKMPGSTHEQHSVTSLNTSVLKTGLHNMLYQFYVRSTMTLPSHFLGELQFRVNAIGISSIPKKPFPIMYQLSVLPVKPTQHNNITIRCA